MSKTVQKDKQRLVDFFAVLLYGLTRCTCLGISFAAKQGIGMQHPACRHLHKTGMVMCHTSSADSLELLSHCSVRARCSSADATKRRAAAAAFILVGVDR